MPPSAETNGQGHRPEDMKESREVIYLVAFTRLICALVWTCGILYSTYQLILAAEGTYGVHVARNERFERLLILCSSFPEFLPWQRDPVMNPGPLTRALGRGRDSTDHEWTNFTYLFLTKLIYWYVGYVVLSLVVPGMVSFN